jgi:hypothetical protein
VKVHDLPPEHRKWDIQLRVRCCKLKAIEARLVTVLRCPPCPSKCAPIHLDQLLGSLSCLQVQDVQPGRHRHGQGAARADRGDALRKHVRGVVFQV